MTKKSTIRTENNRTKHLIQLTLTLLFLSLPVTRAEEVAGANFQASVAQRIADALKPVLNAPVTFDPKKVDTADRLARSLL